MHALMGHVRAAADKYAMIEEGDFTVVQNCSAMSANHIDHLRGHLHTSVNEPIGSLYVGVDVYKRQR